VLFQAMDEAAIAARVGVDVSAVQRRLADAVVRLKGVRDRRPAPFVDRTQYAGWVALVASGHLAAARWLGRREAGDSARRALDRLWLDGWSEGMGMRHRTDDPDSGFYLDDHAHVGQALFDAWVYFQDDDLLARCRSMADAMIEQFRDPTTGAFRDRPAGSMFVQVLSRVHTPIADSPTPSGNGSAALLLQRLHAATGEARYGEIATGILHAFAGTAGRMGSGAATWLKALAWAVRPVTSIIVVDRGPAASSELFQVALRTCRPRVSLRYVTPSDVNDAPLPPALAATVSDDAPRAYVCAGQTCALPVSVAADLRRTLASFRG
jgi:uncharacterized protein YyaL (SSP411 family)